MANTIFRQIDIENMRCALRLAKRGLGNVWPNPAVGCVLVREDKSGQVVGRGWTQPGGRPHAETEAIRRAGELCQGASAYVSLEPCAHKGETQPCVEQIIRSGISKVFVATGDPDKRVSGAGISQLRRSGIQVIEGLLEPEARQLNAGFLNRIEKGRPYIIMKLATTMDGRIAAKNGESKWITGKNMRRRGHLLRAQCDAIITGVETVISDNPNLTCRVSGLEQYSPTRIVADSRLRTPSDSNLLKDTRNHPTWIATLNNYQEKDVKPLLLKGCQIIEVGSDKDGFVNIADLCALLADRGITRLLVEGGQKLTTSFLNTGIVDELHWFRAPMLLGGEGLDAIGKVNITGLADAIYLKKVDTWEDKEIGDVVDIFRRVEDAT